MFCNIDSLLYKHWHHLPQAEVETLLETSATKGLDIFDLEHRHQQCGPNRLTTKKGKGPFALFFSQFHQPLIYILLAATLITFLLQEWVDSGVIFGVVLVNAIVGFIQESKAMKAIEALARSMEGSATVIRAGKKSQIPSSEVLPGDLVLLQSGDKVPADLRLIHSRELQIDESALTGESVPVQKQPDQVSQETILAERYNMAYSSTLVTYGTGTGLVVATGDATEIGQINALIISAQALATPLTRKITQFSGTLLWIILSLAGLTVLAGLLHGDSLLQTFIAAVALAVGAIPEGLPAAMTIMLAIGVSKMASRNAVIRRMPAVEALGSTTVICSDKTGTLTQNQMTVQEVCAGGICYEFSGAGYAPEGDISLDGSVVDPLQHNALTECLRAGLLCNDSRLVKNNDVWSIEGDPTEAALLSAAFKAGLSESQMEHEYPRLDSIPFESQHHYMATLHQCPDEVNGVIYLKGSVESIISRCINLMTDKGQTVALDEELVHQQVHEMAKLGLRVLAFAKKQPAVPTQSIDHGDVTDGLTFLGLQAMNDPPRQEAITAVRACQQAGIEVKMITGDHVVTAATIAHQIGLEGTAKGNMDDFAISGHHLAELSDQELIEVTSNAAVFARVTPELKLRLVESLEARGHVVAMTGDGVNDAPALRQADIGIAMGMGGTEVAKEASDMILTDDNFSTIEAAVEEGRAVFDNLVKFITWTLPTNVGEGLVILLAVFLGVALPITPVQILWINMTTAILLGMMLVFEDKEPGIMARPPRRPETPVITRELTVRIGLVSLMLVAGAFGLFNWVLDKGMSLETARTVAVNMFVFGELFYLFNCRSLRSSIFHIGVFTNRWLIIGVLAMATLQVFMTYSPTMNLLFGTAPIGLTEWGLILGSGLSIFMVVSIDKWLRRIADRKATMAG